MMDLFNKLMADLPVVVPCMIAVNVIIGGVGQLLGALHQNAASGVVGSIAGVLKKATDLLTGNLPH